MYCCLRIASVVVQYLDLVLVLLVIVKHFIKFDVAATLLFLNSKEWIRIAKSGTSRD